jgi:lipid-A-disaccharide synthase
LRPDVDLLGMGGSEMEEAGVRLVADASEVAVVGLLEVIAHLPAIRRAMSRLQEVLDRESPDIVVPVDFPDFNLRLAARARRAGIEVVYFVSPQIWAWRRGRVRTIRKLVRRVLVLFPFETAFYERAGVPVTFVGHPAVESLGPPPPRQGLLERAGLDPSRPVVALLPGSRLAEIRRLLPRMLGATKLLLDRWPGLQFVIPKATTIPGGQIEAYVQESGLPGVRVVTGLYPEILTACTTGAVASGTASLDAALMGLPIAVVYRVHPVSYLLGRLLVRVEHVALPNLVAGERIVPELLQGDCTPRGIAAALARYLAEPEQAARVRERLEQIRRRLGDKGAYDRAATAILREAESELKPDGS